MSGDEEYKSSKDLPNSEPLDKSLGKSAAAVRTQSHSHTSNDKSRETPASSNSPSELAHRDAKVVTESTLYTLSLLSTNKKRQVIPTHLKPGKLLQIVNLATIPPNLHKTENANRHSRGNANNTNTYNRHDSNHLNSASDHKDINIVEHIGSHFEQLTKGSAQSSPRLIDSLNQRRLGRSEDHPIVINTDQEGPSAI